MFRDVSDALPRFPFQVRQLRSGPHENFHYVIADPATKRAAVVDPAFNVDRIFSDADADGYSIDTVLLTHVHWDHVGGLADAVRLGAKQILVGAAAIRAPEIIAAREHGATVALLRGESRHSIGRLPVRAIATPGHQPEGVCFLVGAAPARQALITGDTLFVDSCGRTDFPGGDTNAMFESMATLRALEGDIIVLPGHDYATQTNRSLAEQKHENPALATRNRAAFNALHCLRH